MKKLTKREKGRHMYLTEQWELRLFKKFVRRQRKRKENEQ